jgi:ATP-dependent Clp protease ATP-binding subunit ClpC
MFDRFSTSARTVIAVAHKRSLGFEHDYIGSEHLLLGLLGVANGPVDRLLAHQAIFKESVVTKLEGLVARGKHKNSGPLPFTPQAKEILTRSSEIARRFGPATIEPLHLLLATMQEPDSVAAQMLIQAGWNDESAERWIVAHEGADQAGAAAGPPPPSTSALGDVVDQLERILRAGISEGRWTREQAQEQLRQASNRLEKP